MSNPVNLVTDLGADPTGSTNSSAALQAMMVHNKAGYIPPGLYRVDDEVDLPIPKIIWCFAGDSIATGWDDGNGVNFGPGIASLRNPHEQAAFYTTNTDPNFNMFTIRKANVMWKGGCIDFQNLTGHNGAAFFYDLNANNGNATYRPWAMDTNPGRAFGRNNLIRGVTIMGSVTRLRTTNPGLGSVGIRLEFPPGSDETNPNSNAYFTRSRLEIKGLGLDTVFDLGQRGNHPPGHYANGHHVRCDAHYCRQILRDRSFFGSRWYLSHWAGDVFNTQANAQATASIDSTGSGNIYYHPVFYDFRGLSGQVNQDPTSGYWYNQKTINITTGLNPSQDGEGFMFGLNADDYSRRISMVKQAQIRIYSDIQLREGAQIL